jgi:spore maturation protein CgeB
MDYRFQKFSTIYPAVTARLLSRLPNYDELSYRNLYDAVAALKFAWSDYYARHMRDIGREAENIFADVEPLQKAWARERGVKYSARNWLREIAIAQVREFQPDVIFIEDLYVFDAEFRRQLRAACQRRVFLIGYRAAPTEDFAAFRDMDLLLTCVPNFAARLAESGAAVAVLRHAFEPAIISALGPLPPRDFEFTFTGQLVLQNGYHQQRRAIIETLLQSTPLQMWIQVSDPPPTGAARVAARFTRRAGRMLQQIGVDGLPDRLSSLGHGARHRTNSYAAILEQRFPGRSHPAVFGLENFRILARSRITFNNHIDAAEGHAGNMRLFESTGMGTCLLTDWKKDLSEIFEPDREVIAYRNADECVEKVNYLLTHEKERREIAAAGQRRTLQDHTFAQRALQLDELICRLMAGRSSTNYSVASNQSDSQSRFET